PRRQVLRAPYLPDPRAATGRGGLTAGRRGPGRAAADRDELHRRLTTTASGPVAVDTVGAVSDDRGPAVPLPAQVSTTFEPARWRTVDGFEDLTDLTYHRGVERATTGDGVVRDLPVVRIAFDRPEVRNAFRPHTVDELYRALDHARRSPDVAAVLLTG